MTGNRMRTMKKCLRSAKAVANWQKAGSTFNAAKKLSITGDSTFASRIVVSWMQSCATGPLWRHSRPRPLPATKPPRTGALPPCATGASHRPPDASQRLLEPDLGPMFVCLCCVAVADSYVTEAVRLLVQDSNSPIMPFHEHGCSNVRACSS